MAICLLFFEVADGYRKVLCEGESATVRCGKDQKIRVIRGQYGRSDASTCYTGIVDEQVTCAAEKSLLIMYDLCSGKQSCALTASDGVFGNACSNSSSYLEIEYFCEGIAIVCEGNVSTVRCPNNGKISIINANYGRRNKKTCPHGLTNSIYCYSKVTVDVLLHECEMMPSCRFDASSLVFGDPCPPTYKYLEAHYRCNN